MNGETVSTIIPIVIFVANMILLFQVFSARYNLRISIGLLVLFFVCHLTVELMSGPMRLSHGLPRGVLYFPLLIILLRGSLFQKLFAFSLELVFTVSVFLLTGEAVRFIFGNEGLGYSITMFAVLLPIYTLYVVLGTKYRSVIYEKLFAYGSRTEWALYSFVGLASFGIMTLFRMTPIGTAYFVVIMFFILLSFFVLCFAIVNTHEKSKQRFEAEFAREVISSGRGHYHKMDEMYDKLRILRHDYKHHLIAIGELAVSDDKDGLSRYLEGISAQLSESELPNYSSNSIINALISNYAERCAKSGIAFTADIALPETLSVPNYDLCIVIGNLLENALEACRKQTVGKKTEIILKPLGGQLVLRVKNSFDGRVSSNKGRLTSMKQDGGFGLRSVESVAARYDGEVHVSWTGDTFSAYVTLKL